MILAFDIGNTNITIGGFQNNSLVFVASLSTDSKCTSSEYAVRISSVLKLYNVDNKKVSGAIVSSVVPNVNNSIRSAIQFVYGIEPLFVGPGVKTGMNIHCDIPSSVGSDLICAAVYAYSVSKRQSLIIDLSTSTNITVLDKSGTFSGVCIMSGVNTSLEALIKSTAQLPQISLEAPKSAVGKNTSDCMRSGAIFGSAASIDGMIDRITEEVGCEFSLFATGVYATIIIPHCMHKINIEENMVLQGLNLIYQKNLK